MGIKREACDAHFSTVVRRKANFTCECCGKTDGQMDCAHIWGRRCKSVRWSLDNAVCLCRGCHQYYTENPLAFSTWLSTAIGETAMDILNEKRNILMKTTKLLRKEIAKHYLSEIKKMDLDSNYQPISYN